MPGHLAAQVQQLPSFLASPKAGHFEKMLYDNALLAYAYLEAFARTGRHYYREIACRTLDYALR